MKRYRYYSVERRRNDLSEEYGQDSEMESDPSVTWRPRRALSSEYFIEIMVAADAEMVRYHGKGLLSYILGLMSTVRNLVLILASRVIYYIHNEPSYLSSKITKYLDNLNKF